MVTISIYLNKHVFIMIRQHFETFFLFFLAKGFDALCKLSPKETICMKCQILFSRKNKKNISLSSAESAHSMVSANVHS